MAKDIAELIERLKASRNVWDNQAPGRARPTTLETRAATALQAQQVEIERLTRANEIMETALGAVREAEARYAESGAGDDRGNV